jgi:hypothetical protein
VLSRQEEDRERRETLRNDLKVRQQQEERRGTFADQSLPNQASTFLQFAQADAATPRGMYSQVTAVTVVGATAVTNYPAAAPHQRDPVPDEPPLPPDSNPALEPLALPLAQAPEPTPALVGSLSQNAGDPTSEVLTQRTSHASGPVGSPVRHRRY